jgi:hypothetical protein
MKHIKRFNESLNKETKCKWCDKNFKPTKKGQFCCSPEHDSKYNNYLTKDNSENPWDKHTKDNYKDNYYQD